MKRRRSSNAFLVEEDYGDASLGPVEENRRANQDDWTPTANQASRSSKRVRVQTTSYAPPEDFEPSPEASGRVRDRARDKRRDIRKGEGQGSRDRRDRSSSTGPRRSNSSANLAGESCKEDDEGEENGGVEEEEKEEDGAARGRKDSRPRGREPVDEALLAEYTLPAVLPFKKSQVEDRFPKGNARGRYFKHLKQILQAENFHEYPPDEVHYLTLEAPPSMYPARKYCDVTGLEAKYTDPHSKLRFANPAVFAIARALPYDTAQAFLALRNAQTIVK